MAANPNKISTFSIPNDGKVEDSDWKDDIDTYFAIYGGDEKQEGEYISPEDVSKESLNKIKSSQVRLAFSGLKKFRQKEQRELQRAT